MPSGGKKQTEMIFCAMLIAPASAQRSCRYKAALVLQTGVVAALLALDHCPSESRSPWSQHHAALGRGTRCQPVAWATDTA